MAKAIKELMLPDEQVMNKIYLIRGKKVMPDRDLAGLYDVETRTLNQAVRRNIDRFPEDFMFQLTEREFENWKSQFVISNSERMSVRKRPLAFTEQGMGMLSGGIEQQNRHTGTYSNHPGICQDERNDHDA